MADTSSQIRIVFDGTARGVVAAAAEARSAIAGLNREGSKLKKFGDESGKALNNVVKGMSALGAASSAVQVVGGVAGAIQQLAPAALLLPGALLAGGAAMATFKIATDGMGKALKAGLSGDMQKFAEDTKNMAPAMQDAAKAAVAFKPQIDNLRKTVQGNFWGQFSGQIATLGGTYLPLLTTGLGDIATQMGVVAKGAISAAQTPFFRGAVASILSSTASFMREIGSAVGDALTGFVGLGSVGARFLGPLGESIGGIALKFRDWVTANSEAGGAIERMIASALAGFRDLFAIVKNVGSILASVFTGLGAATTSPLANLRALTAQLADFLKTAEAQDGLKALGDVLATCAAVMRDVLMTALREIAPLLVDLAPAAKAAAEGIGAALVTALQIVGPLLRDVARFLSEHTTAVKFAAEAIVGLVLAVKTLQIFNEVKGWITPLVGAFRGVGTEAEVAGTKAEVAATKTGKLKGALTGWGALGAALALGAVAQAMDDLNVKAAGGEQHLTGVAENLHDITGAAHELLSGDFGRIGDEFAAQMDETLRNIQSGKSAFGEFLGFIKRSLTDPLPPITFDVNTGPGRTQVRDFLNEVNTAAPKVNINGNTNDAGFALREILDEINQGKGEVVIDGRPIPAQDALNYVIGLINNGVGEVNINGNNVPAGQALADFLTKAQGSTATAQLNADPTKAHETVGGWTRFTEGTTGMAQMNANPVQANNVLGTWKTVTAATIGLAHLNAEPRQADATTAGWKGAANATTGVAHLNAERGQANASTSGWVGDANRSTGTAHLHAEDSSARSTLGGLLRDWGSRVLTWTVNIAHGLGFASGGPVFTAASGGAIHGPGTGTSDTAGLFRLSSGEHVLTAREVQAAGGHAAIFRMRRQLMGRPVPQMATSGRAASGGSITPGGALTIPAPLVNVQVHVDGNEVRSIVRTEIQDSNRQTRRTVGAGAGATF